MIKRKNYQTCSEEKGANKKKVEKVVSGFSHLLCKTAGNFFVQLILSTSVCENHGNAEGNTVLCLHGKNSLKCFLIMSCHTYSSSYERVSGGGFRHLKEVQASDANCTSLISHFIVVKPRETQNLLSWGMKLKIILFTRVTPFFHPGFQTIVFVPSYCI